MRSIILYCSTFLLLTFPVAAQEIKMPDRIEVQPGRLTKLEITYDGDDFSYEVSGGEIDAFREYSKENNKVVLRVVVYTEGNYTVFAATSKDKKLVTAKCEITAGKPIPPPNPSPDPEPDPEVSLPAGQFNGAKLAYKWAKEAGLTTKGGTKEVANSFLVIAKNIELGTYKDVETALKALKLNNNNMLAAGKYDVKPWNDKFGKRLEAKFNELYDDKTLTNDLSGWKVFLEEIALGLNKVK